MKNWKRYFSYEKLGQKFIIKEVFETPLPKSEDKRARGNNSIYVQYIELLLLNRLGKKEGFSCSLTKKRWFYDLGMVNNRYVNMTKNQIIEANHSIQKFDVNNFYFRANQKLEKILFDALRNLKNRMLIDFYDEVIVVENTYGNSKQHHRVANDEERKCILDAKKQVLNNMGYEKISQVYLRYKAEQYYRELNILLQDQYGWDYTYKRYKIIYNHKNIVSEIPNAELRLQQLSLNGKVIEAVKQNAKKEFEKREREVDAIKVKVFEEYFWGEEDPTERLNLFEYPDNYIDIQNAITEYLMRIN